MAAIFETTTHDFYLTNESRLTHQFRSVCKQQTGDTPTKVIMPQLITYDHVNAETHQPLI